MITGVDVEKQTMKASKPAMEKRRRARINESLQQLKALVLGGLNKNNSRHSKLEKADILEMTVRYLRSVQRQQVKASLETDPAVITQYRTGFAECMGEVSRYLGGAVEENPEVRARLIGHLAGYCTSTNRQQQQQQQTARYAAVPSRAQAQSPGTSQVPSTSPPVAVRNNDPRPTPAPSSVRQRHRNQQSPMQVGFPTPPLSSGGLPSHRHPVTLMTSPAVEGARTGGAPPVPAAAQAPPLQTQRQSPAKEGGSNTPTSLHRVPVSEIKPPATIAQSLPAWTSTASQPAGDVITLILPSQSLPGGQVPTHLIPVYAQAPSKGLTPPLGFSFAGPETVPSSIMPQSGAGCKIKSNPKACAASMPSPKVALTAPAMVSAGQPAAWTAIPLTTAQLVSPQAGAMAPNSAVAPPFTFSIPFNAKFSPPGLAVQAKQPTEQMGRPIRLPGVFVVNNEASGDNDPMWRPW